MTNTIWTFVRYSFLAIAIVIPMMVGTGTLVADEEAPPVPWPPSEDTGWEITTRTVSSPLDGVECSLNVGYYKHSGTAVTFYSGVFCEGNVVSLGTKPYLQKFNGPSYLTVSEGPADTCSNCAGVYSSKYKTGLSAGEYRVHALHLVSPQIHIQDKYFSLP